MWPRTADDMAATFTRLVGACLLLFLCGCSPGYYIRAAYEEGRILWRRTPITTVLAEDGVTPEVRRKLEMVLELRDFAATDLRLNVGGSYASYSQVDRPVLLHVLSAVPKTSFEPYTWWFPFVGRMPYKGFFDGNAAREEAGSLAAQGYDTHIRPAGAFSTLGWFDDPLLGRLLKLDRVSLADVVLHELLHNTLFVPGSVAFNESLANFVGKRGAIEFFTRRFGPESPGARAARRDWREEIEFSGAMMELTRCLRALYAEPVPDAEKLRRREQVFAESRRQWAEAVTGTPRHRYASFSRARLNNAVILQSLLYVTDLARFEELYRREGKDLPRAIEAVRAAAPDAEDPFDTLPGLNPAGTNGNVAGSAATRSYELCERP
ncbi:MAG: aminopeptidase [Deltaproteobacteria bacterium]|nr:aminopeptidase [Deltaproteobacteria bacterium]